MGLFSELSRHQYGRIHFGRDAATGLEAIVAIHDTTLGPALGGCRFLRYEREEEAIIDALRLARGMTYKAAITGLPQGGGKSVILRPRGDFDRAALFTAFGRFVDALGGQYITAEDSGTGVEDMEIVRRQTRHVTGVKPEHDATGRVLRGGGGDPSPFTALGVRRGIEAAVKQKLGRADLTGIHVAIQGVGHVGYHLAKELHALGAQLTVADVDNARTERCRSEFGAQVASGAEILATPCDVLAPCALGAVLDDVSIAKLRTTIIAGAANNQLAEPRHGDELHRRGIAYAPDYAINAGGLVNVAAELAPGGYDAAASRERVLKIHDTILEILERSAATGVPSHVVSDRMAEERLAAARRA
jgi:leucine dehydrogenase